MNKYLIEVKNYFGETRQFVVEAESANEAKKKAITHIEYATLISPDYTSIKVVKKLRK